MRPLAEHPLEELRALLDRLRREHGELKARGLTLNIARGKPASEQLNLSNALLSLPDNGGYVTACGDDARNYGGDLRGLIELREIFSPVLGVPADRVVAGGNSSLAMIYDCLVWALLKGVPGGDRPWSGVDGAAFLCPSQGYEKHHVMCDEFGIELLPVPVTEHGPDMNAVAALVDDPRVKGMWCVPTYANPTGEVYSDETVRQLAAMHTAAPDFRLFWDDAYVVHHLDSHPTRPLNIFEACEATGNVDRPLAFTSTSKMTFAGGGVGFFGASATNVAWYLERLGMKSAGPDKLNQLRHARFLQGSGRLREHMAAHRALLAPKFDAILQALTRRLSGTGAATWSSPQGGYFISIEAMPGTARRTVALAEEVGVALTVAGSTWPRGKDPIDSNIRIAPSFATLAEVKVAADVIALTVLLSAVESVYSQKGTH